MTKWMQAATKRMERKGTEGSLTRIAKRVGQSPMEYARAHYHSKGTVGQKARFAVNAQKRKHAGLPRAAAGRE